ncbi:alkyl hydroperoxide reductase [Elizabethkingia anophelis]|uniref:alkyl hydroperoxide reductase n=1 Tax=Elizabethkingia anophelis TaxID=1117645 RepID=UPI00373407A3
MMKLLAYLLLGMLSFNLKAQQIGMNFPKFAGKSYDFIIFQGDHQETVYQGVIPEDGKFVLSVPEMYGIYTGMSRWLITGTEEGGGLDMFIPGHDFSVTCTAEMPNEKNIIYSNNIGNSEINTLHRVQEGILSRYQAMLMATGAYDTSFSHYSFFKTELEKQKKDYMLFQKNLRRKQNYASRLLSIVNITKGLGEILTNNEEEKGKDIAKYISQELDWNTLYTSGHWSGVIQSWVSIHSNVLKDTSAFVREFKMISNKISSPKRYTDFSGRVSYYLNNSGKEDYINAIAPVVTSSGKIPDYEGSLSSYLTK